MGKIIGLVVALLLGFGIYRGCFYQSPSYLIYLKWAQAARDGDCSTLYALADGDAKKWVDSYCTPSGGMTIMGTVSPGVAAAAMVSELRNTPQGSMMHFHHELESEDEAADGTIQLSAIESVMARATAHFKPAGPHRQILKLKHEGETWKVLDYKDVEVPESK